MFRFRQKPAGKICRPLASSYLRVTSWRYNKNVNITEKFNRIQYIGCYWNFRDMFALNNCIYLDYFERNKFRHRRRRRRMNWMKRVTDNTIHETN